MPFDIRQLADRLAAAAGRLDGITVTTSNFDLILSLDGYGARRSEAVPFAALFLRPDDVLAQALDRLEAQRGEAKQAA